ncbi:hypothetical protein SELMODRAFT_72109, partial [Selaginella moellendorffii]
TAMVAAFAKGGRLDKAMATANQMPGRDTVSWNALITMLSHYGFGSHAVESFRSMCLEGGFPNQVSYLALLIACNHKGLSFQGLSSFSLDFGVALSVEHYCTMIDVLGRSGELTGATDLVNSMPYLPGAVAWGSLLGACTVHSSVKQGAVAAENLAKMENGPAQVLYSNIIA